MFSAGYCRISDRDIATSRTTASIVAVDALQEARADVVEAVDRRRQKT